MKGTSLRATIAALLLLGVTIPVGILRAQAQQDLYSPVIYAHEQTTPNLWAQMRPDGTGLQEFAVGGFDLMHSGSKGQRYFLGFFNCDYTKTLPNGSYYCDLGAFHENGGPGIALTALVPCATITARGAAVWSFDDRHLAYGATQFVYDPATCSLIETQEGIFVADVVFSATGVPMGLQNEHPVILVPDNPDLLFHTPRWSGDGARLTYTEAKTIRDSSGKYLGTESTNYLIAVSSSDPSAPVRLSFVDSQGAAITSPSTLTFSPVPGDPRLAFVRTLGSTPGCFSNHIWVASVPTNYDGSYALTAQPVTNNKNANLCDLGYVEWAPDATFFVFHAYPNSRVATFLRQVFKVKADGSVKAIQLTNSKKQGYEAPRWRR